MITLPRITLVLALLHGLSFAADPPAPSFSSLFGKWKVVRIVGHADITGSEKDAKAGLGATVMIAADNISDTYEPKALCVPKNPRIVYVDTERTLNHDWGTTIHDIRLPRGTLKARMPYLEALCSQAFVINQNEMLYGFGNGFDYLIRRQPN